MSMPFRLRDAAIARDVQVDAARREFEKACERAAAVAATRRRTAERGFESARRQAHKIAVIRARIWREHHELGSQELRLRLAIHEARLLPDYRPVISAVTRADETWYVRMIRSELIRRQVIPDPRLEERRQRQLRHASVKWKAAS